MIFWRPEGYPKNLSSIHEDPVLSRTRARSVLHVYQPGWLAKKKTSETSSGNERGAHRLPLRPGPQTLSADWSAGRVGTRTAGVHADHAGLIGEVHVLSGGTRGDRRGRNGVGLVA